MKRSYGLYVHIPFCEHKCSYCDFYSIVLLDAMDRFTDALCREIDIRSECEQLDGIVDTIFWGGGTPSLLKCEQVERIAAALRSAFPINPDYEWTIEANPGTVTYETLSCYRQLGINRISFGVQSFDDRELAFLERIHTAEQVVEAFELSRRAGFENINLDVIYALPGQELQTYRRTLERVCALKPEHVSAYSLMYERGTTLYNQLQQGKVIPLNDDEEAVLYRETVAFLTMNGYQQYEVSNFSQPQKKCRHNLLYWRRGEYLGFGPSAHSHIANVRWSNVRSLARYLDTIEHGELPIASVEHLSQQEQRTEMIFLGLRAEGIDLNVFAREFGIWLGRGATRTILERWQTSGWARLNDGYLRLTSEGYALCDALTMELLEALEREQPVAEVL